MPILRRKNGWVVVSLDGTKDLTPDNLSREQAEKREKELLKQKPIELWAKATGRQN